jgi:hypothetical protein
MKRTVIDNFSVNCRKTPTQKMPKAFFVNDPDSRQQTADSRQQTADSRQQTADSRQQTADSRQIIHIF